MTDLVQRPIWTCTDWPDWKDIGNRVEIELENGQTVAGELTADDFYHNDQGDEIPVFMVQADDGSMHDFADHARWRFL